MDLNTLKIRKLAISNKDSVTIVNIHHIEI